MEIVESEKPVKDRGNMVTSVISSKLTESTNSGDVCGQESVGKTGEMHNGGEQVGTSGDGVGDTKTKKKGNENTKNTDTQDSEHASNSEEKWQLHLDVSDSASTSDNDGSEVETNERNGENLPKKGDNDSPLADSDAEDSGDFLGFEMDTGASQDSEMVLTKLIGLAESALKCARMDLCHAGTSREFEELGTSMGGDTERKLDSYSIIPPSIVFIDCDNEMDVDECEGLKFSLKLISGTDMLKVKEEVMDEDSSSRDNIYDMGNGEEVIRSRQLSEQLKRKEGKIDCGDGRGSETRKKRKKKAKEKDELLKEEEVTNMMDTVEDDTKLLSDMSLEVSSSADVTTPVKAESGSDAGTTSEEISSEVTSSAAGSPSFSSRSSCKVSGSSGRYSRDSPALSSSGVRGKKVFVDLSNPAFLKPFEYGWKRELVYRNTSESALKKMADIYYYTPTGKKVRSNREVLEYLDSGDLTIENFTFFKEALGLNDSTKEIIRDAKKILSKDPGTTPAKKTTKLKPSTTKPSPLPETLSSSPPSQSSKVSQQGRTIPPKTFPKIKVSCVKLQKLPIGKGSGTRQKKNESSEDGEMEIGMLPPMWSPDDSPFLKKAAGSPQTVTSVTWSAKSGSGKKSNNEPCSIRCVGVMGLIPSLQCRVCLCLYHPECVGLGSISETIHSYVCKNCQQEVKDGKPASATKLVNASSPKLASSTTPPPLTPISALGAGNKVTPSDATSGQSAATPSSPPKLQRLPRMGESGKLITVPRFVKVPRNRESALVPQQGQKGTAGNKGTIVGSVTTWLPPSSTIQLSPSGVAKTSSNAVSSSISSSISSTSTISDPLTSPPNTSNVQSIARMGGKKYIVVPKHNVLSVSPAVAATATTPTSKSSVQVGDQSPLGDKAPVTLSSSLVLTNTTGHATTVLGSTQGLIGQPQVLMSSSASASGQTISLVQGTAPVTNFVSTGGPILPQPSAYLVSSGVPGGLQNPPGVLLVPFVGSGSTFIPTSSGQDAAANKNSQYLIVNGPPSFQPGNFIISSLQQTQKPTDNLGKTGDTADGTTDEQARDVEDVSKGKHKLVSRETDGPPAKRLKSGGVVPHGHSLESERHFMQYFMMNVCAGYSSLLHVFQYLKVQELLRAARVCRMWHDMASHPSLWRTVRMKNSHVGDWEGLVKSLRRHETQHLDLRKMLVPNEDTHSMWDEFCRAIVHATSLSRLDLCRCPARVVERVAESCPQLKIINALSIKCSTVNMQSIGNQKNLQELRLKSLSGIHLSTTLAALKQLSSLKHLSLTTFKELGKMEPNVLGSLKNLESLELGECCDFPPEFGPESLSRLKKLERLRLEKGQGKDCPTFSILAGIATLPKLTHLELVNFDVKPGFDKALAQCTNIRRLLIIPTYVTQSATTNHMVLNGVNHLCNSLTHFVWGVTHELLRVTELFVDQCEGQKDNRAPPSKTGKKSSGSDSIPILKPIHIKDECETEKLNDQENGLESNRNGETRAAEDSEDKDESDDAKASAAAPQVEILPLPKLQRLLTSSLPKTKVKILKIPFHATWRQTISEPAP